VWATAIRTLFALLVLPTAFVSGFAHAAPEIYRLDGSHTTPMFEVLHLGLSLPRGFFTNASGTVAVDPAGRTGSVDVVIGSGSVVTGSRVLGRPQ
jgi:polyisoprenoid-binding protein YceI